MIYLDHAATTGVCPQVMEAMLPFFTEHYGNPSSLYAFSDASREAMQASRTLLADAIGARPEEIYFTSGGSESDNWAVKGTAFAYQQKGKHIITTKIEHHAIERACAFLEKNGYEITWLDVGEDGRIRMPQLYRAIRPDTILISVMMANNETGTIQPVEEIGRIARSRGILFHTDAVQAFGQIPIQVNAMNIDMLSVSAHKIGGPKGIGFLYIRKGVMPTPLVHGGGQENGMRAGTENVPEIVGFGKAAEIALNNMKEHARKKQMLRDYFIDRVVRTIPYTRVNGSRRYRLPGNLNFSFQFIDGGALLSMLDMEGVCASAGSACSAGQSEPSHVLTAMGVPKELAYGSLRLTLGDENTKEEVDFVVEKLADMIGQLRENSAEYHQMLRVRRRM